MAANPRLAWSTGILSAVASSCFLTAEAVTLIVGIPSPETTPKKELLLTHESQLGPWRTGREHPDWNSFTFFTYGITDKTELSFAINNIGVPGSERLGIAPGFKTYRPILTKRFPHADLRVTGGAMMPVSLRGDGVGYWTFVTLSGRVPKLRTRLTAGVSAGSRQLFGREKVAAIVGIEQPLTKKLSVVADWYSGTHDLGAFIPAVQYNFTQHDVLILGVKIPNNANSGKQAVIIEFTKRLR